MLELKDQLGEGYHYNQTTWEASTDTDGVDVTFVEDTWDGIKFDVTASGTFKTKKTVKVTIKITDRPNNAFCIAVNSLDDNLCAAFAHRLYYAVCFYKQSKRCIF